jgi:hypothetical protein
MRFVEIFQSIERHVLDHVAIRAVPPAKSAPKSRSVRHGTPNSPRDSRDVLRSELELVLDTLVLERPLILLVRAIDEVVRQLRKHSSSSDCNKSRISNVRRSESACNAANTAVSAMYWSMAESAK